MKTMRSADPEVTNKDGIGNTIVSDNWSYAPTKDGAQITIKGPYEHVVINVSRDEMELMKSKSLKVERELGNNKIFRGHTL